MLANFNWYFYNIDKGYILEDRPEWLYKTQDLDNLCGQLSSRHYNNDTLIKFYQYDSLNKTSLMEMPVDVPVWLREISPQIIINKQPMSAESKRISCFSESH